MTSHISGEFAQHLSSKNFINADLSLGLKSSNGHVGELSLRRLWELTDLSANDFADEVAVFYSLPRLSLPQLIAAAALTGRFSRRFLRETAVFPYQSADGRFKLAVADPGDVAAVRAAEIVLCGPIDIEVASFEDIATALTERLGEEEESAPEVSDAGAMRAD